MNKIKIIFKLVLIGLFGIIICGITKYGSLGTVGTDNRETGYYIAYSSSSSVFTTSSSVDYNWGFCDFHTINCSSRTALLNADLYNLVGGKFYQNCEDNNIANLGTVCLAHEMANQGSSGYRIMQGFEFKINDNGQYICNNYLYLI